MANAGPLLLLVVEVAGAEPFQQGGVSVPIVRRGWLRRSCRLLHGQHPARSLCLIGGARGHPSW